jgi:RyR domain-containing protein
MPGFLHAFKDRCQTAFSAVSQYRWAIHALLVFFALALGFWGWMLFEPGKGVLGVLNNIFRTVQLIALQFPTDFRDVPWQLQVARLLVPLFAVVASFHVLIGSITRPVRIGLLPFARNHIFIYGLEALTDAALAAFVSRGRRVVIVAATVDAARLGTLEGLGGVTVVDSDPLQPQTFKSLALKNGAAVFLVADDDVANLNVAMLVLAAASGRPADLPPLILAVRIQREDLAKELDAALDGLARSQRVQYHRLSPSRESLRLELAQFAPIWTKRDPRERSHVLLVGLTGTWQQVAFQIIVATQDHPTERPILTFVVTNDEAEALQRWRTARPELDLIVEIEVLIRGDKELLPSGDAVAKWRAARPVPHLAIVLREDADAISTMLALRRPGTVLATEAVPMLVHQSKEDRVLYRLGEIRIAERDLTRLVAFGGLVRAESIDRVLDRAGDEVAIRLHAHYLDAAKTLPPGSPAALATWDGLTENLRDANRVVADHSPILFAAAGLMIARSEERTEVAAVTPDELERLAMIEHRRWMADRLDHGWRRGAIRDDRLMLHTDFVPWDELSDSDKQKDCNSVRALIASLAEVGRVLVRKPRP